jgi:hypothetical protein
MIHSRVLFSTLAAAALGSACRHAAPAIAPPPAIPAQQIEAPPTAASTITNPQAFVSDTAKEIHVDIDTHNAYADVRDLLDYVARQGNFTLVYSPRIDKKVRVRMYDVPVSVALQTLLSAADLTVETSTPNAKPPGSTSVVFYQLPVNVDSLSVDAIMKRFGVSRTMAELIVSARTIKP